MSNKTQTEQAEKTASAPKKQFDKKHFLFVIVLIFIGLFILLKFFSSPVKKCRINVQIQGVGGECLKLERVSNRKSLTKGLSGRESMPDSQGMLFIFASPEIRCFWMKEMKFPLDIIWMDANKYIVTVEENVQPNTYPNSFCPDQQSQYVIEVNSGVSKRAGLVEGKQLQF